MHCNSVARFMFGTATPRSKLWRDELGLTRELRRVLEESLLLTALMAKSITQEPILAAAEEGQTGLFEAWARLAKEGRCGVDAQGNSVYGLNVSELVERSEAFRLGMEKLTISRVVLNRITALQKIFAANPDLKTLYPQLLPFFNQLSVIRQNPKRYALRSRFLITKPVEANQVLHPRKPTRPRSRGRRIIIDPRGL